MSVSTVQNLSHETVHCYCAFSLFLSTKIVDRCFLIKDNHETRLDERKTGFPSIRVLISKFSFSSEARHQLPITSFRSSRKRSMHIPDTILLRVPNTVCLLFLLLKNDFQKKTKFHQVKNALEIA